MQDGDIWKSAHTIIRKKGSRAVKFPKAKGHATKKMVEEGRVRPEDKDGNDEADTAATRAVREEGPSVPLAKHYGNHLANMQSSWRK